MKTKLLEGEKVHVLSANNAISEWIVGSVIREGLLRTYYRLVSADGDSFCVYEESAVGRELFVNANDAAKERERRLSKSLR